MGKAKEVSWYISFPIICLYWLVIFAYDLNIKFRNWCNKPLKNKNK